MTKQTKSENVLTPEQEVLIEYGTEFMTDNRGRQRNVVADVLVKHLLSEQHRKSREAAIRECIALTYETEDLEALLDEKVT